MVTPVIQCYFTNGIGNNIFQYVYARLLAEKHGGVVSAVNGGNLVSTFAGLGIQIKKYPASGLPVVIVNDTTASTVLYSKEFDNKDFVLKGYFSDYTFYKDYVDQIRSWFICVEKLIQKISFSI